MFTFRHSFFRSASPETRKDAAKFAHDLRKLGKRNETIRKILLISYHTNHASFALDVHTFLVHL